MRSLSVCELVEILDELLVSNEVRFWNAAEEVH
jgi:hypothetical protein